VETFVTALLRGPLVLRKFEFMDSIGVPVEGYGLTRPRPLLPLTRRTRLVPLVAIGGVTVYIMDENGHEVPDVQKVRFAVLGCHERVSRKQEATDEVISVAPTVIHACLLHWAAGM
jgi:hypothetical protein